MTLYLVFVLLDKDLEGEWLALGEGRFIFAFLWAPAPALAGVVHYIPRTLIAWVKVQSNISPGMRTTLKVHMKSAGQRGMRENWVTRKVWLDHLISNATWTGEQIFKKISILPLKSLRAILQCKLKKNSILQLLCLHNTLLIFYTTCDISQVASNH